MTRKSPDSSFIHYSLGLTYALLGHKGEAISEAERAVELTPLERDAGLGERYARLAAGIYALVGDREAAIDEIEYLLSIPGQLTVIDGQLISSELYPSFWDTLRDHPRFQALLEKYDTN